MTELNPVTSTSQNGYTAPIGARSNNIFLFEEELNEATGEYEPVYKGTLTEFFQNWENFKENGSFIHVGDFDPTELNQVKVWYQTYSYD